MQRRDVLAGLAAGCLLGDPADAGQFYEGTAQYVPGWRSTFFQPHEFASKGNGRVQVTKRLVRAADRTRTGFGQPIRIVSGYRDPRHNRAVGGARRSRHLISDAIDIDISRYDDHTKYVLAWYLLDSGMTSFGTYSRRSIIHADMRPSAAIWRHGGGGHPRWLIKALRQWKWRTGSGSAYR